MGAFHDLLRRAEPLRIDVGYYNAAHEDLLMEYPCAEEIWAMVQQGVSIPPAEFLTYCLFVNQRADLPGLSSYRAIKANLNDHLGDFNAGLEVTRASLRTHLTGDDQLAGLSEKIGVGIALSVVGHIHGLTEADWERIPKGTEKSLDFRRACDDAGYVQVEAKGRSVANNAGPKTKGIYNAASDIAAKKVVARAADPSIRAYGTIGAIDQRPDSIMKCWLLDPPGAAADRDPRDQRILNRLHFIAEALEFALPGSLLTLELYKRLLVLHQSDDLSTFNGRPLDVDKAHLGDALLQNRIHSPEKKVIGSVVRLADGTRFFSGLRRELFEAAYWQDFAQIRELRWRPASALDTLVGFDAVRDVDEPPEKSNRERKPRTSVSLLHTTAAGRVLGLLE